MKRAVSQNLGILFAILVVGLVALLAFASLLDQVGAGGSGMLFAGIVLPLSLFLIIGLLARTNDPLAYRLAGREVSPLCNGLAIAGGWLSATSVFALAGVLYALGYDGLAFGLGWAGGLALATLIIAPHLRRSNVQSVTEFFSARFGAACGLFALGIVALSTFVLLVAELSLAASIYTRYLMLPEAEIILLGLALIVLVTIFGGMRAATWLQITQALLVLAAYLSLAHWLSIKGGGGVGLAQISYGQVLPEITKLEIGMIEKGLAEAKSLKPHVRPFLQLNPLNFLAISLCLMAGVASLPHILTRFLTTSSASTARRSGAWALLFVFLVLFTAPAYAAFAKLEIYTLIAQGTKLAELPPWIETSSRLDLVRIHGVSLGMFDRAVALAGIVAPASLGDQISGWADLKGPVRLAVLDAARAAQGSTVQEITHAFATTVLPAAAQAAGNKTGLLTLGALNLNPSAVVLMAPDIAGAPFILLALGAAGALGAALATANLLVLTLANAFAHHLAPFAGGLFAREPHGLVLERGLLLAVSLVAGLVAIYARPADPFSTAVSAFSLAGAGLFPALVLGIWWRRANGWGAAAAMVCGLGLSLYYLVATRYFAVDFYETWSHLSNASDAAARKFATFKGAWSTAEGDAKPVAWTALEGLARGTPTAAGIANWGGVLGSACAIFGLPLGFLAGVLVSLLTPRPDTAKNSFLDDLRKPQPEPVAESESLVL